MDRKYSDPPPTLIRVHHIPLRGIRGVARIKTRIYAEVVDSEEGRWMRKEEGELLGKVN